MQKVNSTIVECNTAYAGPRLSTEDHLKVVADHGFTAIAPVDIMDAEGEIRHDLVGSHMDKTPPKANAGSRRPVSIRRL